MSVSRDGIIKLLTQDNKMTQKQAEEFYEGNTNEEAKREAVEELFDLFKKENDAILEEIKRTGRVPKLIF